MGGEPSYEKRHVTYTPTNPSARKRSLEVVRSRLKGVVGGKFIDSLCSVDELWDWRRCLEVRDSLSLHDVPDCPPSLRFSEVAVGVLDEGDDAHLCFALGAPEGVHLVDSFYARGPTAPSELPSIVTLRFFDWRRGELSAFASSPAGVSSVVSCDAFVGLRYMTRKRC